MRNGNFLACDCQSQRTRLVGGGFEWVDWVKKMSLKKQQNAFLKNFSIVIKKKKSYQLNEDEIMNGKRKNQEKPKQILPGGDFQIFFSRSFSLFSSFFLCQRK